MRTRFILSTGLTCLTCLAFSTPALAAVTLPTLFSDHMVVQRNMEVPVWGTDTANQSITVKLGTQQATGKAGADGKWTVRVATSAEKVGKPSPQDSARHERVQFLRRARRSRVGQGPGG